jgi:hypothetical protein
MISLGTACLLTISCGGQGEEDVSETEGALVGSNGFAANGFAANGFAANGFAANGFAANGFAANGFAANGFAANGFAANGFAANGFAANGLPLSPSASAIARDPASREFFKYIVSCALPEGALLTLKDQGQTYTFGGALGVAPEWLNGRCDTTCQRWVTACVLARVNHLGQHVEISIRGDNRALAIQPHEIRDYSVREATYYGNFFQTTPEAYTCLPPGASSIVRVCGPSLSDCPMTVAGSCDAVCAGPGPNGTFRDCAARASDRRHDDSQTTFSQTITVFLRP